MLIAFIIGVPMAVMVMFVRFPPPSVFCVTVDPVMVARLFTMVVACVMCPPGGSVLTVKAKLVAFPRAFRRTICVVDVPPDVPAAVTVLLPVVWAVAFPRAFRRTVCVVDVSPDVPAAVTVLLPVVWAVVDCLILIIPITSIKINVLMQCMKCSFHVNGNS
jgi:hypothetical protein